MDRPSENALLKSLEQLYALGALNDFGELTKIGRQMAEFPLDPCMTRALLASEEYGCSEEVVSIISMLSVQGTLFYRPKDKRDQADMTRRTFAHDSGDHLALLSIWKSWESSGFGSDWCYENFIQHRSMKKARDIKEQILGLMKRVEILPSSKGLDPECIRKSLLKGYFFNTAKAQPVGDRFVYKTLKTMNEVAIHPSSFLFGLNPPWVMYHELVLTSREYMRQVSEIDPKWLLEVAPHYCKKEDVLMNSKSKTKR